MNRTKRSRWALSFADLCLLLLGFFVLLQAHRQEVRDKALTGLKSYFGDDGSPPRQAATDVEIPASALFVPAEAMLTPAGHVRILAIARDARQSGRAVHIASRGTDPDATRFDGWDLAAARMGAVARALAQAGLPHNRIRIAGPDSDPSEVKRTQMLMIRSEP